MVRFAKQFSSAAHVTWASRARVQVHCIATLIPDTALVRGACTIAPSTALWLSTGSRKLDKVIECGAEACDRANCASA